MENPSSICAWNEYLKTFVNELCETFPECPDLFVLLGAVDAKISEDEYSVLETFLGEIEPHTEALTNMDENFFLNSDIDFLKKLGVKQYWTPDLEPETKQAIWQYLQTLLVMGKTIKSVPPEMLRMLENYATKITAQMDNGEIDPNSMDLQTLGMGAIQHMQGNGAAGSGTSATPEGGMFSNVFQNITPEEQAHLAQLSNTIPQNFHVPGAAPVSMAPVRNVVSQPVQNNTRGVSNPAAGSGFDQLQGQFMAPPPGK
uniref:Uncharacterized protein n=1 Tax=viral metagenome TaxID=1070528 RepID=A0A6C0BPC9_9ZZZZ